MSEWCCVCGGENQGTLCVEIERASPSEAWMCQHTVGEDYRHH